MLRSIKTTYESILSGAHLVSLMNSQNKLRTQSKDARLDEL
jgi:hypothetical protein